MPDKTRKPGLLISRPAAAAGRFLAAINDLRPHLGRIVMSPAISIEPSGKIADASASEGVVFSSAHAVDHTIGGQGQVAYCVGQATAKRASAAGFAAVSADGDGSDLVAMIERSSGPRRLLHPRGRYTRVDIGAALRPSGFEVEDIVVYDQVAQDPSAEAQALLDDSAEILLPLFSPRTAIVVSDWFSARTAGETAFALSEAIAAAWKRPAIVTVRQDQAAMVQALTEYIETRGNG